MSKAKAKTYKSEAMAAVREMMEGLHDAGSIDKRTMREFDEACLAAAPVLSSDEIKAIREAEHVAHPVFARYLRGQRTANLLLVLMIFCVRIATLSPEIWG